MLEQITFKEQYEKFFFSFKLQHLFILDSFSLLIQNTDPRYVLPVSTEQTPFFLQMKTVLLQLYEEPKVQGKILPYNCQYYNMNVCTFIKSVICNAFNFLFLILSTLTKIMKRTHMVLVSCACIYTSSSADTLGCDVYFPYCIYFSLFVLIRHTFLKSISTAT